MSKYKVYSQVLNQLFDTVEELEEAEKKYNEAQKEKANNQTILLEQVKSAVTEYVDYLIDIDKETDEYHNQIKELNKIHRAKEEKYDRIKKKLYHKYQNFLSDYLDKYGYIKFDITTKDGKTKHYNFERSYF